MSPLWQVIGAFLGYLVGMGVRYISRARFWRYVGQQAQHYIEDPRVPIDDPREAAERALVDAQRPSVERVARRVKRTIRPDNVPSNGGSLVERQADTPHGYIKVKGKDKKP